MPRDPDFAKIFVIAAASRSEGREIFDVKYRMQHFPNRQALYLEWGICLEDKRIIEEIENYFRVRNMKYRLEYMPEKRSVFFEWGTYDNVEELLSWVEALLESCGQHLTTIRVVQVLEETDIN